MWWAVVAGDLLLVVVYVGVWLCWLSWLLAMLGVVYFDYAWLCGLILCLRCLVGVFTLVWWVGLRFGLFAVC